MDFWICISQIKPCNDAVDDVAVVGAGVNALEFFEESVRVETINGWG